MNTSGFNPARWNKTQKAKMSECHPRCEAEFIGRFHGCYWGAPCGKCGDYNWFNRASVWWGPRTLCNACDPWVLEEGEIVGAAMRRFVATSEVLRRYRSRCGKR